MRRRTASYTMLTVTFTDCAIQSVVVPSGLDFEAAGSSIVRSLHVCLIICFKGIESPNMTWALFRGKCRNTQKSAHPPLWRSCKVLHPWPLFCKTTVYLLNQQSILYAENQCIATQKGIRKCVQLMISI